MPSLKTYHLLKRASASRKCLFSADMRPATTSLWPNYAVKSWPTEAVNTTRENPEISKSRRLAALLRRSSLIKKSHALLAPTQFSSYDQP